jgi:Zn-dependent protease/CBS domain-containing protein
VVVGATSGAAPGEADRMIIGSVLGLRVRAHPTWVIIMMAVVASLMAWTGGPAPNQLGLLPSLLAAVVVALLFFASVLAHELAHAVVARRRGLVVEEISMLMVGGASGVGAEPTDAVGEGSIAFAGPLLSGVVGGLLLAVASLIPPQGADIVRVTYWIVWWLGAANLLLALFNLIPVLPFDGGRLLRAVAWRVSGDLVRATRVVSLVGRGIAYGMIFLGFVLALEGVVVGGLWLALVGWFLSRSARGSYNQVRLEQLVGDMRIGDALERDVAVVSPTLTLDTLVEQHELRGDSSLYPVTVDGELVGAIDIDQVARIPSKKRATTRVTDVMRQGAQLIIFTERQPLIDAVARFEQTGADAFAVVDGGDPQRLLGVVTRDGVIRLMRSRAARRRGLAQR